MEQFLAGDSRAEQVTKFREEISKRKRKGKISEHLYDYHLHGGKYWTGYLRLLGATGPEDTFYVFLNCTVYNFFLAGQDYKIWRWCSRCGLG